MKPLLLDQIRVASPCQVSWDEMQGDDRQRFCSHCSLHVYNLSDMTRPEAEEFVKKREGRTCIRFFQRHDGTMLTRDCPVGLQAIRVRVARMLAGVATIMGGLLFGGLAGRVLASGGNLREQPRVVQLLTWLNLRQAPPPLIMGKMAVPLPIQPSIHSCIMGEMVAPVPTPPPDSSGVEVPVGGEAASIE
jgi:hypothetical protein